MFSFESFLVKAIEKREAATPSELAAGIIADMQEAEVYAFQRPNIAPTDPVEDIRLLVVSHCFRFLENPSRFRAQVLALRALEYSDMIAAQEQE